MTGFSNAATAAGDSAARSRQAARLLAETIVKLGAVMVTATPQFQRHVLGHIAWLGDRRLFWFEATGAGVEAAHCFEYDELCRVAHRGVAFFRGEEIVGYICTLATAATYDEAWVRAMHQLWSMDSPRRRAEVCEHCDRLDQGFGPRSCAWRLARCWHARDRERRRRDDNTQ